MRRLTFPAPPERVYVVSMLTEDGWKPTVVGTQHDRLHRIVLATRKRYRAFRPVVRCDRYERSKGGGGSGGVGRRNNSRRTYGRRVQVSA